MPFALEDPSPFFHSFLLSLCSAFHFSCNHLSSPCKPPHQPTNIARTTTQPLLNSAPHLSMEERGRPAHDNVFDNDSTPFPAHHDDPASLSSGNPQRPFCPGTYVVQVPKDQIYRVPTPEHAAFAEHQRKLQPGGKRSPCSCLCVMISTVVVIPLVLAIIGGLCIGLIKKDNPNILVDHVLVKNHTPPHHPGYDITLGCKNPNQHTSIFYGQNGDASLSFRSKEIATGKTRYLIKAQKVQLPFKLPQWLKCCVA